jgi:hypothetical protein
MPERTPLQVLAKPPDIRVQDAARCGLHAMHAPGVFAAPRYGMNHWRQRLRTASGVISNTIVRRLIG